MPTIHLLLILCSLLPASLLAQTSYFEGSLFFEVELKGAKAELLMQNEPNTKLIMHLKDDDYIVQLSGGRYPKTFLFIADSNYEYSIDMASQRAFRYSAHTDFNQPEEEPVKAQPTGRQVEVLDIMCNEYRLRKEDEEFLYYVHDDYRVNTALYPLKPRAKASFLAPGLEGRIPLMTIKRTQGLTVRTTVKKISPQEFDAEQFAIPPGFTVKNRDYRF
ncbi:MAG: hypothetical protein D6722_27440 [Bacteroidetes bacterium]|nr:MAG: hypothetical protein D6722_27440 [Bacteroidota bacterium]